MGAGRYERKSFGRIHPVNKTIHVHPLHGIDDAISARMVKQQGLNTEHVIGKHHYSWIILQDLFDPVHCLDIVVARHNCFLKGAPAHLADAPDYDKNSLSGGQANHQIRFLIVEAEHEVDWYLA